MRVRFNPQSNLLTSRNNSQKLFVASIGSRERNGLSQRMIGKQTHERIYKEQIWRLESDKRGVFALGVGLVGAGLLLLTSNYTTSADEKKEEKKEHSALDPNSFKQFALKEIHPINHNTKLFRFALDDPNQTIGLPVASCLVVKANIGEGGKPVIRPYTPTNTKDAKGYFDLVIKYYENGVMSKHIHNMKVGDKLEVKGPITKIPYKPNSKKEIGMLAGGSGITPFLQILREALHNPNDDTHFSLVFANVKEEDILLRDELDELAVRHPNFKVYYVLDNPPKDWKQGLNHINEDIIRKAMPPPSPDNLVMVCGPPGMMKAISGEKSPDFTQGPVSGLLKKLNYDETNVFKF